jgi:[acyl-carrier-protein] S-malonyltransferase
MAGDGLLEEPLARELLDVAAGEGLDLATALLGDDDALRPTEIAQPALLLVGAVLAGVLPEPLDVVAVAGHSVGEYAACVAAGAIKAADAMRVVIERGRAMAAMREGTMSAIIGLDEDAVAAVCAEVTSAGADVVVANLNAPAQTVISGSLAGIEAAEGRARERGARRVVRLNVSGAFHSPLMADAAARVAAALAAIPLAPARIPIVANVDAEPVTDPDAIRERLERQLTAPVRWIACVHRSLAMGASTLVEVGPGSVLSGLARRIVPDVVTLPAGTIAAARGVAVAAA